MKKLEAYIDGASKGNPGHAGIGAVICQNGEVIKNINCYIGQATNNVAEYKALICVLEEGLILKADSMKINTDSQLLCNQIKKIYKIKNTNLYVLYKQAVRLIEGFKAFEINFIPRTENRGADKLANRAIREGLSKAIL